jgi:hypothetical protein
MVGPISQFCFLEPPIGFARGHREGMEGRAKTITTAEGWTRVKSQPLSSTSYRPGYLEDSYFIPYSVCFRTCTLGNDHQCFRATRQGDPLTFCCPEKKNSCCHSSPGRLVLKKKLVERSAGFTYARRRTFGKLHSPSGGAKIIFPSDRSRRFDKSNCLWDAWRGSVPFDALAAIA